MRFVSTRGGIAPTALDLALAAGLAPDGGLYVPEAVPTADLARPGDTLAQTAQALLAPYFAHSRLQAALPAICATAYDFPAPLRPLAADGDYLLELFHGPTAAFKDYAARFLAECLARLRRSSRRNAIAPIISPASEERLDQMATSTLENPDDAAMRDELRGLLERRIDELPDGYRTVFVLRCVEELSVEETAACLDLPEVTVRTRQFRARGLLRESLARDLDVAERDAFAFAGARCDRIVENVLAALTPTLSRDAGEGE